MTDQNRTGVVREERQRRHDDVFFDAEIDVEELKWELEKEMVRRWLLARNAED